MDGVKLRANIEEVPIDEIIPYENNPRINDRAVPVLVWRCLIWIARTFHLFPRIMTSDSRAHSLSAE